MLATESEAAILKRVIKPDVGGIAPEVAREILKLGFSEDDHARMAELSERAQSVSLTGDEQAELDGYINISHLLALMHSKARVSLKNQSRPAA